MLQSLFVALNATVPFLIYLTFGYGAKAFGVVSDSFLRDLNRVLFRLFFPFVTFYNIYNADMDGLPSGRLMVFIAAAILLLEAVLLLTVPRFVPQNRRRGVVIQAMFRSNVLFFALPMMSYLYGDDAASLTAPIVTVVVTIFNITSVIILEMFRTTDGKTGAGGKDVGRIAGSIALNVVKNPLLQGAFFGILFLALGIQLPSAVETVVETLSGIPTPMALFVLGGTLQFASLRRNLRCVVPALLIKLLLVPAIFVGAAWMLGLRTMELFAVLIVFASPVAAASYPMAENMGADGELAGHFVVLSTVLSVGTLFLWIFFLNYMGLLY